MVPWSTRGSSRRPALPSVRWRGRGWTTAGGRRSSHTCSEAFREQGTETQEQARHQYIVENEAFAKEIQKFRTAQLSVGRRSYVRPPRHPQSRVARWRLSASIHELPREKLFGI